MTQEKTGRFSDLGIAEKLLTVLSKKGFETPTPIQHQVIPGALEGKDVVGIAQTGTGKTLAFGIPMIEQLAKKKGQGLVVVPTRELALQVEKALSQIGASFGLRTAVIIGGVSQHAQVKSLRNSPHIVIATPGRLADLMKQGVYNLSKITIITLDEADRMLDVGFLPEIKRILGAAPKERQTMLFSATMPESISNLTSAFMQLPIRIEIAPQGTASELVEQEVFVVTKQQKIRLLDALLEQYKDEKILLFSRTKYGAKRIAQEIRDMGHTATEIHSNRSQAQRKLALDGFISGRFRILVATDIAARGIDVKDIGVVMNFDLPDCLEDYVHRIGRTGRAGKYGRAISFVAPSQRHDVKKIERLINKAIPILSLPSLPEMRDKPDRYENYQSTPRGGGGRSGGRNFSKPYSSNRSSSPRPYGGSDSRSSRPRFGSDSRSNGGSDSRPSRPRFGSDSRSKGRSDSRPKFGSDSRSARPNYGSDSRPSRPKPSGNSKRPNSFDAYTESLKPDTTYSGPTGGFLRSARKSKSKDSTDKRSSSPRSAGGYKKKGSFSGSRNESDTRTRTSRPNKGASHRKTRSSRPSFGGSSRPSFGGPSRPRGPKKKR